MSEVITAGLTVFGYQRVDTKSPPEEGSVLSPKMKPPNWKMH